MRPLFDDAFGHHVWATLRVIDLCAGLGADQLSATTPGTFGSIIDTLRHIVGADAGYLYALTAGETPFLPEDADLEAMRDAMERHRDVWRSVVAGAHDPDATVIRYRDDGTESHAPLGIRLAQALHHGSDHRSQICTILTTMGIDPPAIDVWDYADEDGRLWEGPGPPP